MPQYDCYCVEHSYTPIGTTSTSEFVQVIDAEDEHEAFGTAMQRLFDRRKASQTIVSFNVYKVERGKGVGV